MSSRIWIAAILTAGSLLGGCTGDSAATAAKPSISIPESPPELAALVNSDAPAATKIQALKALRTLSHKEFTPELTAAILKANEDPNDVVAILSLGVLGNLGTRLRESPEVLPRLDALVDHGNPVVQGQAMGLLLLATKQSEDAKLSSRFLPFLEADTPFLRSKTLAALGRSGDHSVIPAFLPLLDDTSSDVYEVEYQDVDGETKSLRRQGSADGVVNIQAIKSLQELSKGLSIAEFRATESGSDINVEASVPAAKAWIELYKKNSKSL